MFLCCPMFIAKCAVPEKSIPTPWKVIRNSGGGGGGGVLKAKVLEAKYEAKLEFPGGRGCKNKKTFLSGKYGYFLELHNKHTPPLFVPVEDFPVPSSSFQFPICFASFQFCLVDAAFVLFSAATVHPMCL